MKKVCDAILKYTVFEVSDAVKENNIVGSLKKYRTRVSFNENIPAYLVYSDSTIEELAHKRPKTIEELKTIVGIGDYKIEKYGEEILKIINE